MTARTRLLIVGAGLACACVQPVDAPTLERLEPAWGWNGESTDVVLVGEDFYPGIQATSAESFEIDRQFDAWLELGGEPVPLEGVTLLDLGQLRARVPSGLEPGRYDVGLRTPNGGESVLAGGFSVTETRADHIALETEALTHRVLSLARVGVQLLDPADAAVPEPLDIRVKVVGAEDPSALRFEDTLDDQRWDGTLPGIRGTLGAGGTGFIALTSEAPGELWLEITADEPDSVVTGASQFLAFTAGGVDSIDVALSDEELVPVAGETFPLRLTLRDELGNPTDGALASVTLVERCGDADTRFRRTVVFADEHVLLDAYLTGATGTDGCEENGIEVVGQADGAALQGTSRAVLVSPGPASTLDVQAFPDEVQAGEEPVLVVVTAEDDWGNATSGVEGTLELGDSEGGLGEGSGDVDCRPLEGGVATCEAWPVHAGDDVRILAATQDGVLSGESVPITVLAGPAEHLALSTSPTSVAAGDLFDLRLRAVDAWDNAVHIDPSGADAPDVSDGVGSVSCAWTGSEGAEAEERFACAATHAEPTKVLTATLPSGATGQSNAFEVTNGDLARASVDIGATTSLTAGDPLDLTVQALDTWDNPYTVQTVTSLDIYDKSGEFVAEPAALDASGVATIRLRPTVAWQANQFDAYDGGTLLGRSAAFDVTAGTAVSFGVELPRTWVEVDETVSVTVSAQDAYDNPVPGFAGSATLQSDQGATANTTVGAFAGGVATAEVEWEQVALQDVLLASGSGLSGQSAPVDAVQDCGVAGPVADFDINGDADHITCRVSGATPATSLDATGSTAGDAALLATHFAPDTRTWTRTTANTASTSWDTVGATEVRAVVVDADGCMDEATARVWVGDSDGQPTGPVRVVLADSALVAGSTTLGTTSATFSATDCAGDPAAGGTLGVRADLGTLSSSTTTLSATGAGLELTLDATGEGRVSWSMTTTADDGTATLHAGTAAGSAHGEASLDVSGEFAPPTVLSVDPTGTRSGTFSEVNITFSEPMLASSLNTSNVGLTAPDGSPVTALTLDITDDQTATLVLDATQDAGGGVWSVGVGSAARDAAGNRLDGAWTGGSSAFLLTFGAVADVAPDLTSCTAATTTIRPDGDDGAGDESDDLELSVVASGSPAWWELIVLDTDGELIDLRREAGAGAATTLSWDGRGLDGLVADAGRYEVVLTPLDASWNEGLGCTRSVQLEHRLTAPGSAP